MPSKGPEEGKSPLEMAEELDGMERDLPRSVSDFLDEILPPLRAGEALKPKDEAKLELLHEKYLGDGAEEDDEKEGKETDEDVDEDDFV